jgi:hypothetical protein
MQVCIEINQILCLPKVGAGKSIRVIGLSWAAPRLRAVESNFGLFWHMYCVIEADGKSDRV